jgi:hypothetical protein
MFLPQARMSMPSAAVVLPLPLPVYTITSPFCLTALFSLLIFIQSVSGADRQMFPGIFV